MTTSSAADPGLAGLSPSERQGTRVDGVEVVGSLSPSRAGDFMACPLLYRFRAIDHLPERPSPDAVRGTVVHKVLEDLFDLPAPDRTPDRAGTMVAPAWEALLEMSPELGDLFPDDDGPAVTSWLASCRAALDRYFTLEDPRRLEPAERELYLEVVTASRVILRGIVDRVDVSAGGAVRIVDYKTGRSVSEALEGKALFQLKFYALLLWRTRGVVPAMLQLIYLGNGEILRYEPDEADLLATERKIAAVWEAIARARETADFRPNRGALCAWCSHKALCPAWGGTPPPMPTPTPMVESPAQRPSEVAEVAQRPSRDPG